MINYQEWLKSLKEGDEAVRVSDYSGSVFPLRISKIGRKWITTGYNGRYDKFTGQCETSHSYIWKNESHYKEHLANELNNIELKEKIIPLIRKTGSNKTLIQLLNLLENNLTPTNFP